MLMPVRAARMSRYTDVDARECSPEDVPPHRAVTADRV
jgi:hypothetical protein